MIPDCCQKCGQLLEDGTCKSMNKKCDRWLLWFRREWAKIRRAAKILKTKGDPNQ
jgi:hypothetical protein